MVITVHRHEVYLQPGQYFVGDACYRVRTLLGSCVSMTLWSAARKVGAMSHFVLSRRGVFEHLLPAPNARFGDEALALMLAQLAEMGVEPEDCEAKIFGGGDMFPGMTASNGMDVGHQNGSAACVMLKARNISVVSRSLFGIGYRRVIFDIASGEVWARQVAPMDTALAGAQDHGTNNKSLGG